MSLHLTTLARILGLSVRSLVLAFGSGLCALIALAAGGGVGQGALLLALMLLTWLGYSLFLSRAARARQHRLWAHAGLLIYGLMVLGAGALICLIALDTVNKRAIFVETRLAVDSFRKSVANIDPQNLEDADFIEIVRPLNILRAVGILQVLGVDVRNRLPKAEEHTR